MGELACQTIGWFDKTDKLLPFNNHFNHTNNIVRFFKYFLCPSCYDFSTGQTISTDI